jgi:hypothetical protein
VEHVRAMRLDSCSCCVQADAVLRASAALTPENKAKAEFFDNKLTSIGFAYFASALNRKLPFIGALQACP